MLNRRYVLKSSISIIALPFLKFIPEQKILVKIVVGAKQTHTGIWEWITIDTYMAQKDILLRNKQRAWWRKDGFYYSMPWAFIEGAPQI